MRTRAALLATLVAGLAVAGCGGDSNKKAAPAQTTERVRTVATTKVQVVEGLGSSGGFDARGIYARESPGVVTVVSVFGGEIAGGDARGLGSGFVISDDGEIATTAHVVTVGQGSNIKQAKTVYVQFGDGNEVPARIVGYDPNSDIALLRVDPAGLKLTPLPLGSSAHLTVGAPVAAIGSPFGEPQSLSVGVISALDRTIDSLTAFQIDGAIQTDAAVNHGNSGGPLVDAHGRVLGVNSQIRSTGGGGEGVGFAVPIDTVKRALGQLRETGEVRYAYLGVSTTPLFPQLVRRFHLPTSRGVWIQNLTADGPADKAGLRAGDRRVRFQVRDYYPDGDIIASIAGHAIVKGEDVSEAIAALRPGQTVPIVIYRGKTRRTVRVKLGDRPNYGSAGQIP
jgi:S1-C subfamily serine protease